ncbi:MAG TPA: hypothetical protein VJ723_08300, partial [Candidatus Angelobacter sp.]|nr:hypothetical protein [Candidatus Angelobacter sp.]
DTITFNIQDAGTEGSASFLLSKGVIVSGQGKTATLQLNGTDSPTLQIKGISASKLADNITLAANSPAGTTLGKQKFSVVSVTITIKSAPSDKVSAKDQGSQVFASPMVTNQGPGTPRVGPMIIRPPSPNAGCGDAVEFTGAIIPTDYKGKVTLRRDALYRVVWNEKDQPIGATTQPKEDTSFEPLLTKDPQRATNDGTTTNTVYDLDAPGPLASSGFVRFRANFREYAALGDWSRFDAISATEQASDYFLWFANVSCKSGTDFDHTYDGQGDNAASGATGPAIKGTNCTSVQFNLSQSCP